MKRTRHTKQQFIAQRQAMVDKQLAARGIRSTAVLRAMKRTPREEFLSAGMREFAYDDAPLPIAQGQTISQPYIVALMIEAAMLRGGERVLEVGTGSGYAAAVLAQIAQDVYSIERHQGLATGARGVLAKLGYNNVSVIEGDGSQGWPDAAPYDAIFVTAGGPNIPDSLRQQLHIGGRLIMPIGPKETQQVLTRVTRLAAREYEEESLSDVRFVPLIGDAGWPDSENPAPREKIARATRLPNKTRHSNNHIASVITRAAEPFDTIDNVDFNKTLQRIGDARIVLIGEASHGTSEFYRFRARLSQALITHKGFNFVSAEADWPDAKNIDRYVRGLPSTTSPLTSFTRFPTWMWRNQEVEEFIEWQRRHNEKISDVQKRVGFYGLDLYSMFASIAAVLDYLDQVDPEAAAIARARYGCLTPYQADPATYARAAATGRYRECEQEVVDMLADLLKKRLEYSISDGDTFLDAIQNARLIANAERYYRSMYDGYSDSWNLRDEHMFETLEALLAHHGSQSKAIVWEHNSHVGDASATDMSVRGQINVGQLCRERYGDAAYLIGFGTHTGTVAAASDWNHPMEIKQVNPSLQGSWERACHNTEIPAFILDLHQTENRALDNYLHKAQLERAIGVVYRPDSERASHYFHAQLAGQFDEYVWFDQSHAITPLEEKSSKGAADTYPFGV